MLIRDHAIRSYKKRLGRKTASKKRIIAQINRDLKNDVKERRSSHVPGHYILITSKYQAVCYKKEVFTIKYLDDDPRNLEYKRKREELNSKGVA